MKYIKALVRAPVRDDMPFIYSSWLKSYSKHEDSVRMRKSTYFRYYKKVLDAILMSNKILIACNPDDAGQVYGYIVYNEDAHKELGVTVLHYVYVKYTFRKLGIARYLLNQIEDNLGTGLIVCTFSNRVFDRTHKKYNLTYDPALRVGL